MTAAQVWEFPPFRLDFANNQLWRDDELRTVRPKLLDVLTYLVAHAGRLVTQDELRKAVWPNTYLSESVLRGYMRELRDVLEDDPAQPRFVETVPRRGYRFLPPVSLTPSVASRHQEVASSQHSVVRSPTLPTQHSALSTLFW